jgi:hypothetical protein
MKISALKASTDKHDEGMVVPILDESGEPMLAADESPVTVTVVGIESKRIRKVEDKQTRRVWRTGATDPDPDLLRKNRVELAAAAVIDWHGFEDDNDQPVPCTPENVVAVLSSSGHVLKQVEAGVRRPRALFPPASASS